MHSFRLRILIASLVGIALNGCTAPAPAPNAATHPVLRVTVAPTLVPSHLRQGSGFFISSTGAMMTARHVVEHCATLEVAMPDGAMHRAELTATDPAADLALLQLDDAAMTDTPTLAFAGLLPNGQVPVTIVGFPDTDHVQAPVVRSGMLLPTAMAPGKMVLVRGQVHPGDSGGPVIGADGKVVGLVRGYIPYAQDAWTSFRIYEANLTVGPGLEGIQRLLATSHATLVQSPTGEPFAAVRRIYCQAQE